jgi:hypothetical protein
VPDLWRRWQGHPDRRLFQHLGQLRSYPVRQQPHHQSEQQRFHRRDRYQFFGKNNAPKLWPWFNSKVGPAIHCLQQVQRCEHELRWHRNERPRQQHVVGLSVDYVLTGFKERFRQPKFRPCSDMCDAASQRTQGCDNAAGSHSWTSISVSGQQFRSAKSALQPPPATRALLFRLRQRRDVRRRVFER